MILTEDQASRISSDGLIHDAERLKELQALPLERKIGISTARIIEWYQYWNGNVYVSFSGGKDSTVLLHLVRSIFPDVPAVFSNTGLEYPELQKFVKSFDNVITLYPKIGFREVISTYGYPLISKEVAEAIYYARRIKPQNTGGGYSRLQTGNVQNSRDCERIQGSNSKTQRPTRNTGGGISKRIVEGKTCSTSAPRLATNGSARKLPPPSTDWTNWRRACLCNAQKQFGEKSMFNKEKWLPIARDLPVPISHYCCNIMKKQVMNKYAHETGRKPIIGTMTEESRMRKQAWIRHGCNAFDSKKASSQPLSFWTEQDVLTYIKLFELEIAPVYGDINIVDSKGNIVETDEAGMPEGCKWACSKCTRTGW